MVFAVKNQYDASHFSKGDDLVPFPCRDFVPPTAVVRTTSGGTFDSIDETGETPERFNDQLTPFSDLGTC